MNGSRLTVRVNLARAARSYSEIDSAIDGVAIDPCELIGCELQVVEGAEAVLDLGPSARSDERRRHPRVAQHPRGGPYGS